MFDEECSKLLDKKAKLQCRIEAK